MFRWLTEKKTYLAGIWTALVAVLQNFGLLTCEEATALYGLGAAMFMVGLRHDVGTNGNGNGNGKGGKA